MMMDTTAREGNPEEDKITASEDNVTDQKDNTQGTVTGSKTNSPKNGTVPEAAKDQPAPAPADEEFVNHAEGGGKTQPQKPKRSQRYEAKYHRRELNRRCKTKHHRYRRSKLGNDNHHHSMW